jgi:YesN/AraC family two-component response regulator
MIRLLIVDDEPAVLSALRRAMRRHFGAALEVETCSDPTLALAKLRDSRFDIVMSDLSMPGIDGLAFLNLASAIAPQAVRIVLTGSADFAAAQRAINEAGVFRFLTKPWSDAELRSHLLAAIERVPGGAPTADPQDVERRRLEALEPGITAVEWGPDGEVLMPPTTRF